MNLYVKNNTDSDREFLFDFDGGKHTVVVPPYSRNKRFACVYEGTTEQCTAVMQLSVFAGFGFRGDATAELQWVNIDKPVAIAPIVVVKDKPKPLAPIAEVAEK